MNTKKVAVTIFIMLFVTTAVAFAGHHYHGGKCMMSLQKMDEMDADQDGFLTFDEFSANHQKQLRKGYDMIDSDKDGYLSDKEYRDFLEVHGISTE